MGFRWLIQCFCPTSVFLSGNRNEARNPQHFIHAAVSGHAKKMKYLEVSQIVYTFGVYSTFMKTLSLKLEDQIFSDTELVISKVKKTRNRYINEAVDYYNRFNNRNIIAQKLAKESKLVEADSMSILAEFERISYED